MRVQGLPDLRRLDLAGTAISDRAIPFLARLASLEELILLDTQVSDGALTQLRSDHPRLRIVR